MMNLLPTYITKRMNKNKQNNSEVKVPTSVIINDSEMNQVSNNSTKTNDMNNMKEQIVSLFGSESMKDAENGIDNIFNSLSGDELNEALKIAVSEVVNQFESNIFEFVVPYYDVLEFCDEEKLRFDIPDSKFLEDYEPSKWNYAYLAAISVDENGEVFYKAWLAYVDEHNSVVGSITDYWLPLADELDTLFLDDTKRTLVKAMMLYIIGMNISLKESYENENI